LNPSILLKIYEIAGRVLKNQESFWKKKKKKGNHCPFKRINRIQRLKSTSIYTWLKRGGKITEGQTAETLQMAKPEAS